MSGIARYLADCEDFVRQVAEMLYDGETDDATNTTERQTPEQARALLEDVITHARHIRERDPS